MMSRVPKRLIGLILIQLLDPDSGKMVIDFKNQATHSI